MDSLTHLALGACMGEAFAGKTLGKKAMLWGAITQSIPDIDFIKAKVFFLSARLQKIIRFFYEYVITFYVKKSLRS